MRIGILTFHSQLNYGGVLQCWALKEVLKRMGHDVVVIDRWLTPDNWHLECGFNHLTIRFVIKLLLRSILGCGDLSRWLRHWRTKRFVRSLGLTTYHFYDWKDAPKDLGVDLIVVGSDQVWHGGHGTWSYPTPDTYLLKDAPHVRAIAYAASFGMKSLPPEIDYAAGFKRFDAISVREAEGVMLVEGAGAKAVHVVDPTLLLPLEVWAALGVYKKHSKHIVCYCLVESIDIESLEEWALRTGRTVTVIADGGCRLRPFPKSFPQLVKRILGALRRWWCSSRVRIVSSFGPREFYRAFAEADECITNSFHAVMFSYICNCNVRFLRPNTQERMGMSARIEEFAETSVRSNFVSNDLTAALSSLDCDPRVTFNDDAINTCRDFSRNWLESALKSTFIPHT